jgi:hypothetical protein
MILNLVVLSLVVVLVIMVACLRDLRSCKHHQLGFPINGRQHCNDCKSWRFANWGAKPSQWYRPEQARTGSQGHRD